MLYDCVNHYFVTKTITVLRTPFTEVDSFDSAASAKTKIQNLKFFLSKPEDFPDL